MALQFIFGPSGSGKSYYIYNKIIQESMENPDRQYLVLEKMESQILKTQQKVYLLQNSHILFTTTVFHILMYF